MSALVEQWKALDRTASRHLDECEGCLRWECPEIEALDAEARGLWAQMTEDEREQC
jgi:hypothetical protein